MKKKGHLSSPLFCVGGKKGGREADPAVTNSTSTHLATSTEEEEEEEEEEEDANFRVRPSEKSRSAANNFALLLHSQLFDENAIWQ